MNTGPLRGSKDTKRQGPGGYFAKAPQLPQGNTRGKSTTSSFHWTLEGPQVLPAPERLELHMHLGSPSPTLLFYR